MARMIMAAAEVNASPWAKDAVVRALHRGEMRCSGVPRQRNDVVFKDFDDSIECFFFHRERR